MYNSWLFPDFVFFPDFGNSLITSTLLKNSETKPLAANTRKNFTKRIKSEKNTCNHVFRKARSLMATNQQTKQIGQNEHYRGLKRTHNSSPCSQDSCKGNLKKKKKTKGKIYIDKNWRAKTNQTEHLKIFYFYTYVLHPLAWSLVHRSWDQGGFWIFACPSLDSVIKHSPSSTAEAHLAPVCNISGKYYF